jgi:hypothetical protein
MVSYLRLQEIKPPSRLPLQPVPPSPAEPGSRSPRRRRLA